MPHTIGREWDSGILWRRIQCFWREQALGTKAGLRWDFLRHSSEESSCTRRYSVFRNAVDQKQHTRADAIPRSGDPAYREKDHTISENAVAAYTSLTNLRCSHCFKRFVLGSKGFLAPSAPSSRLFLAHGWEELKPQVLRYPGSGRFSCAFSGARLGSREACASEQRASLHRSCQTTQEKNSKTLRTFADNFPPLAHSRFIAPIKTQGRRANARNSFAV